MDLEKNKQFQDKVNELMVAIDEPEAGDTAKDKECKKELKRFVMYALMHGDEISRAP